MILIAYLLGSALSLLILYWVIRAAVFHGMLNHYKAVRWYEATGEWSTAYSHTKTPQEKPTQLDA